MKRRGACGSVLNLFEERFNLSPLPPPAPAGAGCGGGQNGVGRGAGGEGGRKCLTLL